MITADWHVASLLAKMEPLFVGLNIAIWSKKDLGFPEGKLDPAVKRTGD